MTDILTLIANAGGGGTVTSANLPLSISNGVLSIDLSSYSDTTAMNTAISTAVAGYIPTTHDANKIGSADLTHGQYDINTKTLTLQNGSGVTVVLSVDNGGNVNLGADGVLTVPMLNAWEYTGIAFKDSGGTVRNLVPSLTGGLVYNSSQLVDLNIMATQMATKQDTLTASAGVFLSGATISSYTLRWNGTSIPTLPSSIQELHWSQYTMAETVNLSTGKVELTIGHPTDMATQTWVTSNFSSGGITQSQLNTHLATNVYAPSASGITSLGNPTTGVVEFSIDTGIIAERSWTSTQLATKQAAIPGLIYISNLLGLSASGASFQNHIELRGSLMSLRFNYNGIWTPHSITTSQSAFSIFSYANWYLHNLAGTPLYVGGSSLNLVCAGTVTQNSDRSLKDDIRDADIQSITSVFDSVNVRTYRRNDYETTRTRIGFISQEVEAALPTDFQNIVGEYTKEEEGKDPIALKTLDYSRLVCILWGVCKNQERQIEGLTARVVALEAKKTKK